MNKFERGLDSDLNYVLSLICALIYQRYWTVEWKAKETVLGAYKSLLAIRYSWIQVVDADRWTVVAGDMGEATMDMGYREYRW